MTVKETASTSQGIPQVLGHELPRPWWRRRAVGTVAAAAVVLGGLYLAFGRTSGQGATQFITDPLRKGNITLSVSANGTLQPTRSVNIGSELSGTVREVLVDVNDRVKKGQILVVLDTAKLQDQVTSARAGLAAAQAQLAQAVATLKENQANLMRLEEVARLSGGKVPSAAELDAARAGVDRARASEASARAAVAQAQASLATNETNLRKASIRSPIDGVVLSRTVEPGNAVAASLQAVTLLNIAEDLTQLELEVDVDEADVGSVQLEQAATFTVSAYPTRRYPAKVERVAFGAKKTDNVVTYATTLKVDNQDMSLRPGMTAAATIVATERKDVFVVPNTALRFTPQTASNGASGSGGSVLSRMMPRPPSSNAKKTAKVDARPGVRRIWVLQEGQPVSMEVNTGVSDGRMTEISGTAVSEGLAVIVDQRTPGNKS